jgi:type II secretory pathway component PulC
LYALTGKGKQMIPLKPLRMANIVLAGIAAFLVYTTVESFLTEPAPRKQKQAFPATEAEPTPAPEKEEADFAHYHIIEQANIFQCKDPTPVPVRVTPPPPTRRPLPPLPLELKGTTTSPRDGIVKAILFNKKTRKTDFYREGDVVPDSNGAKIKIITRNKVVIEREGQQETLESYPVDVKR